MASCLHCHVAKGKRACPALGGLICAPCCGRYRVVEIRCPESCPFLSGERYQAERRQERGIRRGTDYVRSRLRIFPEEDRFAFAMEVEGRIYRHLRAHGPVDDAVLASALEALRAAFGRIAVSPPSHPLARGLVEAAADPNGPFSKYREREPGARAAVVATLAEEVRARAGKSPRYFDLLHPFFDAVADPRAVAAEVPPPATRVSPGGIILP